MSTSVFMTGFPGFISKHLLHRLIQKDGAARFTFLIEERLRGVAEAAVKALDAAHPGFAGRAKLLAGDISRPHLGLTREVFQAEAEATTHVWHLAAIYNLAVPLSLAYRVNVVGTSNILDLCAAAPGLKRLDYVSTCYVAGDRKGIILESELDEGQGFKNHYESTKCWAELEVRRRMDRLPVAIHRPAIVLGDSRTGETDKYDGPYFVINLLTKIPSWIPMVNIGEGKAQVNLVPVDFLTDTMAAIWTSEASLGKTFHIADPRPHGSGAIMTGILTALGFRKPMAAVPSPLVEGLLGIAPLRKLLKIPQETVIYFDHEARFDTTNVDRLLQGSNVRCPDLMSYLPTLASYVRQHPDKPFLDERTF